MAMAVAAAKLVVILMTLLGSSFAWDAGALLDELPAIHMLRPLRSLGRRLGLHVDLPCDSWRLAVETNNRRDWPTVPASCENYVGEYMNGGQYRADSQVVVDEAIAYAQGLKLGGGGKTSTKKSRTQSGSSSPSQLWQDLDSRPPSSTPGTKPLGSPSAWSAASRPKILRIGTSAWRKKTLWCQSHTTARETTLSTLPYYEKHGFGTKKYDRDEFGKYALEADASALPETLRLYKKLQELHIKPVILTGRREDKRAATEKNLQEAGYTGYEKLLLKPMSGERKKLVADGYVIVGNIGDQWTDILGAPEGNRTFKLPDPMYYVG